MLIKVTSAKSNKSLGINHHLHPVNKFVFNYCWHVPLTHRATEGRDNRWAPEREFWLLLNLGSYQGYLSKSCLDNRDHLAPMSGKRSHLTSKTKIKWDVFDIDRYNCTVYSTESTFAIDLTSDYWSLDYVKWYLFWSPRTFPAVIRPDIWLGVGLFVPAEIESSVHSFVGCRIKIYSLILSAYVWDGAEDLFTNGFIKTCFSRTIKWAIRNGISRVTAAIIHRERYKVSIRMF